MTPAASEPIFSRESEYALIGAFFGSHPVDAYNRALLHISAEDFHTAEGRLTFRAMQALVQAGGAIDDVLLANRIAGEQGFHDSLRETLQQAAATPYAMSNIEQYARVIAEKAKGRQLAKQIEQIQRTLPQIGSGLSSMEVGAKLQATAMGVGTTATHIELLDNAQTNLSRMVEHLQRKQEGTVRGVRSGIDKLDERIGDLEPGQLVIVAGRPGMGKTVLGMQYADNHGMFGDPDELGRLPLVAVFSAEMELVKLMLRSASAMGRIDYQRIKNGTLTNEEYDRLTTFFARYENTNIRIDSAAALTPAVLQSKVRMLEQQTGQKVSLIVVDYLQLMQGDDPAENRALEISEISRKLKGAAKDFSCPVIALSQLNRGVEQRADKRPVPSDLRESGAIEQDADIIMLIYRDEVYNPDSDYKGMAEIIIGKAREGGVGTTPTQWLGEYQRFDNMPEGAYGYDNKYAN